MELQAVVPRGSWKANSKQPPPLCPHPFQTTQQLPLGNQLSKVFLALHLPWLMALVYCKAHNSCFPNFPPAKNEKGKLLRPGASARALGSLLQWSVTNCHSLVSAYEKAASLSSSSQAPVLTEPASLKISGVSTLTLTGGLPAPCIAEVASA